MASLAELSQDQQLGLFFSELGRQLSAAYGLGCLPQTSSVNEKALVP